jgi:DNA recombination protein RmuC
VTPSTLIALAKSVAYGWRQEQMAKNAEQAKKIGQELYERVAKFAEHMDRVGGGLGNAVKAYNDMVGSLESRVLPSARKLEELQFADPSKAVEDPKPVDVAPRQLSFLEAAPPAPALSAPRGKAKV